MQNKQLLFFYFLFIVLSIELNHSYGQRWTALGPDSVPALTRTKDPAQGFANGIGRVSVLRVDVTKIKKGGEPKLFLGSPYGGLWFMNPGENKWQAAGTDQLMHLGISDFVMHAKCPSIQYIISGDPDCIIDPNGPALSSEFCQSRGIVKSIDGGKTWSDTAIGVWYNQSGEIEEDFWKYPSRKIARRLLIDPKCPDRLSTVIHTYNTTTKSYDGMIFQSEDGGRSWSLRLFAKDGFLKDLEYKPGSGKEMYAAGRGVYYSGDRGKSWRHLNKNGLPDDSLVKRCEIALAPSAPSRLYVLVIYSNSRNSDIFMSLDGGEKFEKIVSAQASPEWRSAIVVDPDNPEMIYFSAGNTVHRLYRKNNGWRQEYTGGFIHDDVHDLAFPPLSKKLYASTDGGLYASVDSGKTWLDMRQGLNVAECWSVAVSQSGPVSVLAGLQDCGTILYRTSPDSSKGWWIVRGGDGMAVAFDYQDEYILYANDGNNQLMSRSIDGGFSWSKNLLPTRKEGALYQRPFIIDPARPGVIYTGMHDVYKSLDHGDNWQRFSDFSSVPATEKLVALALSPKDTNVFYAAFSNPAWSKNPEGKLFKTSDGGKSWKDISKGLTGVYWTNITSLVIDRDNSNILYVGFRGGWNNKVMRTEDAGETWENYSEGLDSDCDVNSLIMDLDSRHTLYAATHHGVYKRSDADAQWEKFGEGLPRVMVSGLDIRYESGDLYAGTHGRGVWHIKIRGE